MFILERSRNNLSEVEVHCENHANYNFSWIGFNEISMEAIGTWIFYDFKDSHYFAGHVGSLMRQK